jgi:mono/diheme cytochrome c family protein
MQRFTPRMPGRRALYRLVAAAGLTIAPYTVFAASLPKATAGQKLAHQYCAGCHVVVPSGKRGWTDAPAFAVIANRAGTTTQTLTVFIERPHMHMENTGRPPAEADEIAAYILSLRKG